jgi:hypothetical protein
MTASMFIPLDHKQRELGKMALRSIFQSTIPFPSHYWYLGQSELKMMYYDCTSPAEVASLKVWISMFTYEVWILAFVTLALSVICRNTHLPEDVTTFAI